MARPPLPPEGWEYKNHPDHRVLLPNRCVQLLEKLRERSPDRKWNAEKIKDTQADHLSLFVRLTPPTYPHFAGNYRGSPHYAGLRHYNVCIGGDLRVGIAPAKVRGAMNYLAGEVDRCLEKLDAFWEEPGSKVSLDQKVLYTVRLACSFFVEFLRIHPYANGNGHMARFSIFAFLARYQLWPKRWPLDDRPPDPPYSDLIRQYRDGHKDGLEAFVLRCVLGHT